MITLAEDRITAADEYLAQAERELDTLRKCLPNGEHASAISELGNFIANARDVLENGY